MSTKENTHNIHLTIKADECPYWNYDNQTCRHTCGCCDDLPRGNTINTVHGGIMIDGNRYCMLNCNVYGEIIQSLDKEEKIKEYREHFNEIFDCMARRLI